MHVLVVDEPQGQLIARCRSLEADTLSFTVVNKVPELFRALDTQRWDAIVAAPTPQVEALSALTLCRLKQPSAARIVLLDPTMEPASIPALSQVAHRVLDEMPSALRLQAILLLLAAQGVKVPDPLADVVGGIASAPSVAGILDQMRSVLADPRKGVEDVAALIGRDPALAAQVLHLANAGFVRPSNPISNLLEASARLGLETLQRLVMASVAFSAAGEMGAEPGLVRLAQRHGLAASAACRATHGLPEYAATGALLIDIGLPLMSLAWPEEHAEIRHYCKQTGTSLVEEERRRLEATHADAGALLGRRWSLPYEVTDMIAGHHFVPRSTDVEERDLGFVAHFAAQLGPLEQRDPFAPDADYEVPAWITRLLDVEAVIA